MVIRDVWKTNNGLMVIRDVWKTNNGFMVIRDVWKTNNGFGFGFKRTELSQNLMSVQTVS